MTLRQTLAALITGAAFLISPAQQPITFAVPSPLYPTIQSALDAAKTPHATGQALRIQIAPGVYRENLRWTSTSSAALTLDGAGAVLTGSDRALWTSLNSERYAIAWPYNWALSTVPKEWEEQVNVPLELRHREMVWVNDLPLLLSLACDTLALNRFCIDTINQRIVFRVSSEPQSVEVAMRETCLIFQGDNLIVRGLTVEHCAADLDKSGAIITGANIVLEKLTFRQNVSGGLNTSNTTNLSTRGLVFEDNGLTGWGGAYNVGMVSTGDTARRNNWRGFAYGATGWWIGAVKHLRETNVVYDGLTITDNLTHGLWMDFNHVGIVIRGLTSANNFNAGVYLEASPGAFTITDSRITNNALGTAYASLYAANTTHVTLKNVVVQSNRAALFIGGQSPCRQVGTACLPIAANWKIHNSTFNSPLASMQFAPPGIADFWTTYTADYNVWIGRSNPFLVSGSRRLTLPQEQAESKQDQNSVDFVPTPTPPVTITPSRTATLTLTRTPTPAPIVPTYTHTPSATENPTPGRHWVLRIEGRLDVWIIEGD